jgi:hypothetical protein
MSDEQDWDNPLVVGFGTATAEAPPYPAQQHLDATDGEVVNPPVTVIENNGAAHTVAADGSHVDHPEGFAYGTRSASDSGGSKSTRKRTTKKAAAKKSAASKSGDDE